MAKAPERQVKEEQARTKSVGGCACAGCIAQILGVYPVTGSDYSLHQDYQCHQGPPRDKTKHPLFNAILHVYGITDIPPVPIPEPKPGQTVGKSTSLAIRGIVRANCITQHQAAARHAGSLQPTGERMKGREPLRVIFVQLLALMGDTFCEKGEARDKRGNHKLLVYFPEYQPPFRRQDKQPMVAADFDEDVHKDIRAKLFASGVAGMVVFECQDMSSSRLGERKGMIYGPGCTHKTLDDVWWYDKERGQVNRLDVELASTQKMPTCYYEKDPADDPSGQSSTSGAAEASDTS